MASRKKTSEVTNASVVDELKGVLEKLAVVGSQPRPTIRPFSGRGDNRSWQSFVREVNDAANSSQWDETSLVRMLPSWLTGEARSLYESVPLTKRDKWKECLDEMARKLSVGDTSALQRQAMNRKQQEGESIAEFAEAIKSLVGRAFTEAQKFTSAQREELIVNLFRNGLHTALRAKPANLTAAINQALEEERLQKELMRETLADRHIERLSELTAEVNAMRLAQESAQRQRQQEQQLQPQQSQSQQKGGQNGGQKGNGRRGGNGGRWNQGQNWGQGAGWSNYPNNNYPPQFGAPPQFGYNNQQSQQWQQNALPGPPQQMMVGGPMAGRPMWMGGRPPPQCYNCGRIGHIKRNCRNEGGGAYPGRTGVNAVEASPATGANAVPLHSYVPMLCILVLVNLCGVSTALPDKYNLCAYPVYSEIRALPKLRNCTVPELEQSEWADVELWLKRSEPIKFRAYMCQRVTQKECTEAALKIFNQKIRPAQTHFEPVKASECWQLLKTRKLDGKVLRRVNNNFYRTETPMETEFGWWEEQCFEAIDYHVEVRSASTMDGNSIFMASGNSEHCKLADNECTVSDGTLVWMDQSEELTCSYRKRGMYSSVVSGRHLVIHELQASYVLGESGSPTGEEQCFPSTPFSATNDALVTFLGRRLPSSLGGTSLKRRIRRGNAPTPTAIYAHARELTSTAPPSTLTTTTPAASTATPPPTTTTVMATSTPTTTSTATTPTPAQSRESEEDEAVEWEIFKNRNEGIENDLVGDGEEEANSRPTHSSHDLVGVGEGNWLQLRGLRRMGEPDGESPLDAISPEKAAASTAQPDNNQANRNVNSRLQYAHDETQRHAEEEFQRAYASICDFENADIAALMELLPRDPTAAMRLYLKRDNISATQIGEAIEIFDCTQVPTDKMTIMWDQKINDTCYDKIPAVYEGEIYFIKALGQMDLQTQAKEIGCHELNALPVYYDKSEGEYRTAKGKVRVEEWPDLVAYNPRLNRLVLNASTIYQSDIAELATKVEFVADRVGDEVYDRRRLPEGTRHGPGAMTQLKGLGDKVVAGLKEATETARTEANNWWERQCIG